MNPEDFVRWLRAVAPYIHAFRGKTFVVGLSGELVAAGKLNAFVQDLGLLTAMGMRIVVVHGSRPQVAEQLRLRGVEGQYAKGLRITDDIALECAKEASGEIRLDLEAAFSQGLPNTPMAHSSVRVISGNFVLAKPVGVVDGIDYLHTGLVRKVDATSIRFALDSGAVVLLSPLGFSPTGEAFNLAMEDLASSTAMALDADKLIFVAEASGVPSQAVRVTEVTSTLESGKTGPLASSETPQQKIIGEISEQAAQQLLASQSLTGDAQYYLREALRACEGGVARAHIVPYEIDGSILLELFQHDGVGSMLVEETLESLREATPDDLGGILAIIRPLEEQGVLARRDRSQMERDIAKFSVIEHDGIIFGCAALYAYPEAGIGEMACLAVSQAVQSQGDGERLLKAIEQRAKAAGLKKLFVLTTRTMHWFLKRGFKPSSIDELPESKRSSYNWARRSHVFIKELT